MKHRKHWGKMIGAGVLILFSWAFVVHMGWNMSMPNIFGLEEIRFKEALGLVLLIAGLSLPIWLKTARRSCECPVKQDKAA